MAPRYRTTVQLDIDPPIIGVGDHPDKKRSVHLAALSLVYQLHHLGIVSSRSSILERSLYPCFIKLEDSKKLKPPPDETEVVLSNGSSIGFEQARGFMDYYCRRYGFGRPDIEDSSLKGNNWETVMIVGGRRIGVGSGHSKKASQIACFLDVTKYLESCDSELWKAYVEAAKTGADLGLAPRVALSISPVVEDAIADLCVDIRRTTLYRNRPSQEPFALTVSGTRSQNDNGLNRPFFQRNLLPKSQRLLEGRKAYLADPKLERIRSTRMSLPVYSRSKEVLDHITNNDVTICMAATGSGKTTQIPQMILDEYIDRGEGANCNIICTQPRRLAAISVADRVAKERGEALGRSIGYHVRFDSKLPLPDGSVTFCTTGVFLKQLQSYLSEHENSRTMDAVTHIVVDEVHERDIDTDLLLVVLKQILAQKKAKNESLKIVLMSATIDPTLFQNYFANESGVPAKAFSVPGRSFPVNKYFLEDYVSQVSNGPSQWVLRDDNVAKYLHHQLGPDAATSLGIRVSRPVYKDDELDLPYPFIAATIGHVLGSSQDGHVLVFLPGWDDIIATQKALLSSTARHAVSFNDTSKYSIHLLHSTIPLAEQQAIFEPPAEGVRRIILATNIAETSITIPDVVYVIDTAKIKEQRYDPERRISSLVTAWVGSSNLNQRAGRAGRHRPGEYYGILSKANADRLNPYQTVEMKRVDLSNVVMHVKALNFSGLSVEKVLAAAIEAPDPSRVTAALNDLHMVGALDSAKNLTSLGRVLVQLPVDAHLGRLVLYGSLFKCLDQALTLAAILANRDPFMTPMHLKAEAIRRKNSWCHEDFRSDALTVLKAFDAWSEMQSRGEHNAASRFCITNFLSKPTLLLIQKIKGQVLQSLYRTGVIDVSAGGQVDGGHDGSMKTLKVPPALDKNRNSLPLLVALIAIASQPRFGVRVGDRTYRTSNDRVLIKNSFLDYILD
jgi:small subunit ribosomal protein S24e